LYHWRFALDVLRLKKAFWRASDSQSRDVVQIARHLGAKKVIATGRNVDALGSVAALGADVTIPA
jgi:hypothetical protein